MLLQLLSVFGVWVEGIFSFFYLDNLRLIILMEKAAQAVLDGFSVQKFLEKKTRNEEKPHLSAWNRGINR